MGGSRRVRGMGVALTVAVGLLGLAGCARDEGSGTVTDEAMTELSWEAQALESIGFAPADLAPAGLAVADPAPTVSAGPDRKGERHDGIRRHKRLRFAFGRNLLHGEAVVQTTEGVKTVVVQRGTITAIDASSVTVKSADGYTLTWTFGDPVHVVEHRTSVQPSELAVGATVGVAGAKNGDQTTARLIVVPGRR
jgi:hypothetical protein